MYSKRTSHGCLSDIFNLSGTAPVLSVGEAFHGNGPGGM